MNVLSYKNGTAPRLYGFPKLHKPNIPIGSIISSQEYPIYNLSKLISIDTESYSPKQQIYKR